MGGQGSGRHRWRNFGALENSAFLDIRTFRRRGWLEEGKRHTVTLRWSWRLKRTEIATADVMADMTDPHNRHIMVISERGDQLRLQPIAIIARKAPFGGLRMFFRCPILGISCEVMPFGPHGFASRRANRMSYASQSETQLDRLVSKKLKLHERLWSVGGHRTSSRGPKRVKLLDRYWDIEFAVDAAMGG